MEERLEAAYHDLALVLAWPDQTARGDERWMAMLKQAGIVKNLNFKVGHAAIVLVHRSTGALQYYDFGRYITPRGYGRARSAASDPRLELTTLATFNTQGHISNLHVILDELHQKEYATHGKGRLFFSVAERICYRSANRFAQQVVERGPIKYGAIAPGNNSCSRFVAQILSAGLPAGTPARRRISLPETIKPSPMSNVVNASSDKTVYCFQKGTLSPRKMGRLQSLRFQWNLLQQNLSATKARALPCDDNPGNVGEPDRPLTVPESAQWLGGIGEGAWYALERAAGGLMVVKYAVSGSEDYRISCVASCPVNVDKPYRFTYHCHHQQHTIVQNNKHIVLTTLFDHTCKHTQTA